MRSRRRSKERGSFKSKAAGDFIGSGFACFQKLLPVFRCVRVIVVKNSQGGNYLVVRVKDREGIALGVL